VSEKEMPGNLLFRLAYDNKVVTYLEEMESERESPEEGRVLCQQQEGIEQGLVRGKRQMIDCECLIIIITSNEKGNMPRRR
jgi:hypothetical protein